MTPRLLAAVAQARALLGGLDRAELGWFFAALAGLQAEVLLELSRGAPLPTTKAAVELAAPGWTDVAGVAAYLGRPERWVYDNWRRFPFARKWDGKNIAFNVEGLKRWDGRLLPLG